MLRLFDASLGHLRFAVHFFGYVPRIVARCNRPESGTVARDCVYVQYHAQPLN
jgi:hypothetical protein